MSWRAGIGTAYQQGRILQEVFQGRVFRTGSYVAGGRINAPDADLHAPKWGRIHRGHAVSRDLTNWEHKDIALFPTKLDDKDGCFSGSAVESDGRQCARGIHSAGRYSEKFSKKCLPTTQTRNFWRCLNSPTRRWGSSPNEEAL